MMSRTIHGLSLHAGLIALALVHAACGASTLHTARPIAPGQTEVGVAASTGVWVDEWEHGYAVEAHVRHGVHERVDLGASGGVHDSWRDDDSFFNLTSDVNVMLLDWGTGALSLDPKLSLFSGDGERIGFLHLPVLVDVYTSDVLTWTVSGRLMLAYAEGELAERPLIGLHSGLKLRLGESDMFLLPELSATRGHDPDGDLEHVVVGTLGLSLRL